jgi:hypothetical protein
MAAANPLWGAPRIHGELLKLGIEVAERTVSRLIPKRSIPPSQTWRTFIANHVRDLVSIDFFTVPTARLRVLFVLVVLAHHRRRLHFNITAHPTAAWTAQQIVDIGPRRHRPLPISFAIATRFTETRSAGAWRAWRSEKSSRLPARATVVPTSAPT